MVTTDSCARSFRRVYSPGGRIAMTITVDRLPTVDWTPDNPGLIMIADLAKLLVEGLGKKT